MATIKGTSKADKLSSKTVGTTIYGYGGNDLLTALAPGMKVYGGDGEDKITGTLKAGSLLNRLDLYGGAGADRISVDSSAKDPGARIFVSAGTGNDKIDVSSGAGSTEEFASVDVNDVIIDAGAGNDIVKSSVGGFYSYPKSTVWGGDGNDTLDITTSSGAVYSAKAESKVYGGDGNDSIKLQSFASADVASIVIDVQGGRGNDVIDATAYPQFWTSVSMKATGGNGNDKISTKIDFNPNAGGDEVTNKVYGGDGNDDLRASTRSSSSNARTEIYGGEGNDYVRAYSAANAMLDGGNGGDTIVGGRGDDKITGGGGADDLAGGLGDDTFIYLWAAGGKSASRDTIRDFSDGDVLDLSAIDADPDTKGDQAWLMDGAYDDPRRLHFTMNDDGSGYIEGKAGADTLRIDFDDFYAITWVEGENLIL